MSKEAKEKQIDKCMKDELERWNKECFKENI